MIPVAKPAITITLPYFMSAKKNVDDVLEPARSRASRPAHTVKVTCKGTCPKKTVTIVSQKGGTVGPYGVPKEGAEGRHHADDRGDEARHDRYGEDREDPGL